MKVALFRCEGSYCFSVAVCECVYVVDVTLCFFLVAVFERFANVNLKPLIRPDGVEKERTKKKWFRFRGFVFRVLNGPKKKRKIYCCARWKLKQRLQNNVFSRCR